MERWEHVRTLDVAQRATLLAILAEQEIALGREAIDENRRRSIQHGSTGDYWLKYHDDELVNVAVIERGPHTPTVELVGGNFDLSLYETLAREGSAEVLWWMRDGSSPSIPFQSVRSLRYLASKQHWSDRSTMRSQLSRRTRLPTSPPEQRSGMQPKLD